MQEIIQSFFKERSLVNHQLASYDDCIPSTVIPTSLEWRKSFETSVSEPTRKSIDDLGGFIKLDVVDQDIAIRLKNIKLGAPTIREANGADHPSSPYGMPTSKVDLPCPLSPSTSTIFPKRCPLRP